MKSTSKNKNKSIFFLLALLGLTVIFLSVKSVSTVVASLSFYGAKNYIEQWEAGGEVTKKAIINAESYAIKAKQRHNTHPLYSDTLSTVLQYKAFQNDNSEAAAQFLDNAEQLNWESVKQRPAWPVTWANLAYIKWLKGEVDDELSLFMEKSSALGPHTPEVHITISNIGLGMSKRNIREFLKSKELIKKHTLLGLEHPKARRAIIDIAANTKSQAMVCTWLKQAEVALYKPLGCV